jgi:hypothetical protein
MFLNYDTQNKSLYYIRSATNEETAKRIANTIVALKSTFSNPRRVWNPPPSAPPNAPPIPAPDCCSSTAPIRRIESRICTQGSIELIKSMYIATIAQRGKRGKRLISNYPLL